MDEKKLREVYKIIDEVFDNKDNEDLSDISKTKTLIKRRIRKVLM